jgi:hypothetical protein
MKMVSTCFRKTKLVCFLTITTLGMRAMNMSAIDNEQEVKRFRLGQRLGDSLVKGCVVFTGVIQSLGALEKEPGQTDEVRAMKTRTVNMKLTEWLYGQSDGDFTQLLFTGRPTMSKTSVGPWLAWEGVTLSVGGQLLVVRWAPLAHRPNWRGVPEDVALVVSDPSLFAGIHEAVAQHRQLERDPGDVAKAPQLLREKHDSLFTGYLLKYLMDGEGVRDVDKAALTLSGLLGHESVPEEGREAIARWLTSDFYRLQEPTRRAVSQTLIVSASADDASAAYPAVTALVRLCDLELLNLKPLLSHEHQHRIAENYRALRAQNRVEQGHPEFELQLGLR